MTTTLITGANRGVGAEVARRMKARGDRVIGCARSGAAPMASEAWPLDVTDPGSLEALEERLEGQALDLLVCNAGALIGRGQIEDAVYTHEAFANVLAVNVTGVFMTIRACLPALRRSSLSKIAVISSQMGSSERAKGNAYLYRASKAAATNLAVAMSKELAVEGIAVGAYHPGWVRTEMGGADADISAEESAEGLIERFDALSVETAGCFEFYSGEAIPF